jgi:tripartite-type tricarboxylate transporter receptor subunit TctC
MELLMLQTGARMQHVPYQGAAQMVGDIAAGRLDAALAILPSALGAIEGKQVVPLAVASRARAPQLPDVPTLGEAGVRDAESTSWLALFLKAGTPAEIVTTIDADVTRAMASDRLRDGILKLGATPMPLPSAAMRSFLAAEIVRWGVVAKNAGLKPE